MAETLSMTKPELIALAKERMQKHLERPTWSICERLALTCRILFSRGHDSGLAGQITARAEDSSHFFTQQWGLGFDEINASNLLTVDSDLNVVRGTGMPNPANRFHTWIYRARPDVQCIIHTHPAQVSALSMLGVPLQIAHMDTCALYDDVAWLPHWPGVPVGNDEGETIAAALGSKRAIILAHHGLLVACHSVEEACLVALAAERAAHLQLLASSAGQIAELDPDLAREAHDWLLNTDRVGATFHYLARRALRDFPDCLPGADQLDS